MNRYFSTFTYLLVSALALIPLAVWAQSITRSEATQRLIGSTGKSWTLTGWKAVLGSDDACTGGEVWFFAKSGVVTIKKCVNGKAKRTTKTWRLVKRDNLDWSLIIGSQKYDQILLPLPKVGAEVEQMRVRIISTKKPTPTIDLRFTHELD